MALWFRILLSLFVWYGAAWLTGTVLQENAISMSWLPALIATLSAGLFVVMTPGPQRTRQTVPYDDRHRRWAN